LPAIQTQNQQTLHMIEQQIPPYKSNSATNMSIQMDFSNKYDLTNGTQPHMSLQMELSHKYVLTNGIQLQICPYKFIFATNIN